MSPANPKRPWAYVWCEKSGRVYPIAHAQEADATSECIRTDLQDRRLAEATAERDETVRRRERSLTCNDFYAALSGLSAAEGRVALADVYTLVVEVAKSGGKP